jgi:hypothetical protein
MKIAIQQPYFYPYIGYFNLISSVDVFVFFNDVQYIRRGWINRNRLDESFYLTVPVCKAPRNYNINQIKINYEFDWHYKHCRSIETKYGKKCLNNPIYLFYKNIPKYNFLVDLLKDSIKNVCDYLKIKTKFIDSESLCIPENIKNKNRIIEICTKLSANSYYNLPGGFNLYSEKEFKNKNIDLKFIEQNKIKNFMSILDVCLKT